MPRNPKVFIGDSFGRWTVSRWVTAKQQANNRTNTIFLTLNQETRSLSEWSAEKKIPISVLDKTRSKISPKG